MECQIDGITINYVERGSGVPLVALHGTGVDHREIEAAVEAVVPENGCRRLYPDLPGMGRTTAGDLACNDDVVALLGDFIDRVAGEPVLLLGHSYGAYIARGIAARKPDRVLGLALLCPVGERSQNLPEHRAVRTDADAYLELEPAQRPEFDRYFVVRTPATARRYREHVLPGKLVDEAALGRIFAGWAISMEPGTFPAPTLIVAGRNDSIAGFLDASDLLEDYPGATFTVIENAGHALMHEQPKLFGSLLADWLERSSRWTED